MVSRVRERDVVFLIRVQLHDSWAADLFDGQSLDSRASPGRQPRLTWFCGGLPEVPNNYCRTGKREDEEREVCTVVAWMKL